MRAVPDLTLSRRLLSALAAAAPEQPPSATTLAQSVGARRRAVNGTLAHLAEDGLLDGLWTGEQWTHLRLTSRGRARARQPRTVAVDEPRAPSPLSRAFSATRARTRSAALAAAGGLGATARAVPPAWGRLKEQAAPRAAAVRLRAAETYRLFTSFP